MKGRVKWFNEKKGFGFVTSDEDGKDAFAHYSEIKGDGFKTLSDGELVEFDRIDTEKGPKAQNIRRLATASN